MRFSHISIGVVAFVMGFSATVLGMDMATDGAQSPSVVEVSASCTVDSEVRCLSSLDFFDRYGFDLYDERIDDEGQLFVVATIEGWSDIDTARLRESLQDVSWLSRTERQRHIEKFFVQDLGDGFVSLSVYFDIAPSEVERRSAFVDAVLSPYVRYANTILDERERADYLVNVTCELLDYDFDYYVNDVYDALLSGRGVCASYAKLYSELCWRCGLDCEYVVGEATSLAGESGLHAWNRVVIDDALMCVDTTWYDTTHDDRWLFADGSTFVEMGHIAY